MNRSKKSYTGLVLVALILGCGTAQAGPDWIEDGDAGSSLGGAQDTTSVGQLTSLVGSLGGADQEDVYRLTVLGGDDFSMPVTFGLMEGAGFNPSLWLFDSEGFGVLANDDDPLTGGTGARLLTPSTDGVTLLLPPGEYFLAITESGNVPLSFRPDGNGGGALEEMFFFENALEVSGPDGIGADNPLADWSGGAGGAGTYGVVITPAPSSLALIGLSGLLMRRKR